MALVVGRWPVSFRCCVDRCVPELRPAPAAAQRPPRRRRCCSPPLGSRSPSRSSTATSASAWASIGYLLTGAWTPPRGGIDPGHRGPSRMVGWIGARARAGLGGRGVRRSRNWSAGAGGRPGSSSRSPTSAWLAHPARGVHAALTEEPVDVAGPRRGSIVARPVDEVFAVLNDRTARCRGPASRPPVEERLAERTAIRHRLSTARRDRKGLRSAVRERCRGGRPTRMLDDGERVRTTVRRLRGLRADRTGSTSAGGSTSVVLCGVRAARGARLHASFECDSPRSSACWSRAECRCQGHALSRSAAPRLQHRGASRG